MAAESADYKAFTTEVSDDLHASAECRDVGSSATPSDGAGPEIARSMVAI
jgi:hypothetical protein